MKNPGALAGATGDKIETACFRAPEYRLRAERATTLCLAIRDCHPEDAAQLMAAALDATRTEGPALAMFSDIRGEAEFWADCASVCELEAVVLAGLRRLGEMALGVNTRKRLFAALWDSFCDSDRMSFARSVGMIGGAA